MVKYQPLIWCLAVSAFLFSCNHNTRRKTFESIEQKDNGKAPEINPILKQSDWYAENLKGKVKSYVDTVYEPVDEPGLLEKGQRTVVYENNYDTRGLLTHRMNANLRKRNTKAFNAAYTYKYDPKGNKIESDDGIQKETYRYDDKGNLLEKAEYYKDALWTKWIFEYDNAGNAVHDNLYFTLPGHAGSFAHRYKYDDDGKKIEEHDLTKHGVSPFARRFKYDEQGNCIEDDEYFFKLTYQYGYDQAGNWIQKIQFDNSEDGKLKPKQITDRRIVYY